MVLTWLDYSTNLVLVSALALFQPESLPYHSLVECSVFSSGMGYCKSCPLSNKVLFSEKIILGFCVKACLLASKAQLSEKYWGIVNLALFQIRGCLLKNIWVL